MATVVTYVLVSNPDDPDAVDEHAVIEEHGFELQNREEGDAGTGGSLRYSVATALQEDTELEAPVRDLSADFPEAVVTFCEVEERFNNVEHFRSVVYIAGREAGEIEHGFAFNVGAG
jgi:hypothetical protein